MDFRSALIIDDDPIFAAIAEGVAASSGIECVKSAPSAAIGIEHLKQSSQVIDLIIVDLNMPAMDGLAFLREASAAGFGGDVVISSGETDAVLRSAEQFGRLLGLRILGALKKPLTPESLSTLLQSSKPTANGNGATAPLSPTRLRDIEPLPYYQPQHDCRTGQVVGLEALARAHDKGGGLWGPDTIFGIVRDAADRKQVSLAIAEAVLRDMERWQEEGCLPRTSINLDASLVEDHEFIGELIARFTVSRIPPNFVCWEVTESSLPDDITRLLESITRLRIAGFGVSIDDYGTGGSNFELLRLCPFSELKIDGTLMRSAPQEEFTRAFIRAAVTAATALGLALIGEGVETSIQHMTAVKMGIPIIQGFWFSRPMPEGAVRDLLMGDRNVLAQSH